MQKISVILCAGGVGSRMQSPIPKQYMVLKGKCIARHSFDVFAEMPEVSEIVVVCASEYQQLFSLPDSSKKITFAQPGDRRQDSVYNGLKACAFSSSLICVHDGARPYINPDLVRRVINAAEEYGAASAGMLVRYSVKCVNPDGGVEYSLDRSRIWEVQTPQIIKRELLEKGFDYAIKHHFTATDDVSLIEQLGLPVQMVEGSYSNIKITTPEDIV